MNARADHVERLKGKEVIPITCVQAIGELLLKAHDNFNASRNFGPATVLKERALTCLGIELNPAKNHMPPRISIPDLQHVPTDLKVFEERVKSFVGDVGSNIGKSDGATEDSQGRHILRNLETDVMDILSGPACRPPLG